MSSPVVGDVSALKCKCGKIMESLTEHYSAMFFRGRWQNFRKAATLL